MQDEYGYRIKFISPGPTSHPTKANGEIQIAGLKRKRQNKPIRRNIEDRESKLIENGANTHVKEANGISISGISLSKARNGWGEKTQTISSRKRTLDSGMSIKGASSNDTDVMPSMPEGVQGISISSAKKPSTRKPYTQQDFPTKRQKSAPVQRNPKNILHTQISRINNIALQDPKKKASRSRLEIDTCTKSKNPNRMTGMEKQKAANSAIVKAPKLPQLKLATVNIERSNVLSRLGNKPSPKLPLSSAAFGLFPNPQMNEQPKRQSKLHKKALFPVQTKAAIEPLASTIQKNHTDKAQAKSLIQKSSEKILNIQGNQAQKPSQIPAPAPSIKPVDNNIGSGITSISSTTAIQRSKQKQMLRPKSKPSMKLAPMARSEPKPEIKGGLNVLPKKHSDDGFKKSANKSPNNKVLPQSSKPHLPQITSAILSPDDNTRMASDSDDDFFHVTAE